MGSLSAHLRGFVLALTLLVSSATADAFNEAAGYYASQQWASAEAAFQRVIRQSPRSDRHADAMYYRAEALMQLGQYGAAGDAFESFATQFPSHPLRLRGQFRCAEARYFERRYVAALQLLRVVLDAAEDPAVHSLARPYYGLTLLASGDRQRAESALQDALQRYPQSPLSTACRLGLAKLAYHRGQFSEMQRQLTSAADESRAVEESGVWQYWFAMFRWQSGELEDARRRLRELAAESTDPTEQQLASYRVAQLSKRLNDTPSAIAAFQQAIKPNASTAIETRARLGLAEVLGETGQTQEALELLQPLVAASTDDVIRRDATRLKGQILLSQDAYEEAIAVFEGLARPSRSLERKMSALEKSLAWYDLGRALDAAGRHAEAREVLARIRIDSVSREVASRVLYARALVSLHTGDTHTAVEQLQAASGLTEADEFSDRVRWRLIEQLVDTGDISKATQFYRAWRPSENGNLFYMHATHTLADGLYHAGEYAEVALIYDQASARIVDNRDRLLRASTIAWCAVRQGNWQLAADRFGDRFEFGDTDSSAAEDLLAWGYCLERDDDLGRALETYRRFLRQYPTHEERWRADLALARVLRRQGLLSQAIGILQASVSLVSHPEASRRLNYELAWTMRLAGRQSEAISVFQALYAVPTHDEYWADATYRLALHAFEANNFDQADAYLNDLVAEDRPMSERLEAFAMYLAGRVAAARNDWQAAFQAFDRAAKSSTSQPVTIQANLWSAESLYRVRDWPAAAERWDKLAEVSDALTIADLEWVRLRQAQLDAARHRWVSARDRLAGGLELGHYVSRRVEASLVLARCNLELGDTAKARSILSKAESELQAEQAELRAAAQWMMGESFLREDNYREALTEYQQVRLSDSAKWFAAAQLRLGECSERLGRENDAFQHYQQIVQSSVPEAYQEAARQRLRFLNAESHTESSEQLPVSTQSDASRTLNDRRDSKGIE